MVNVCQLVGKDALLNRQLGTSQSETKPIPAMTCHAHVFPLLGWCELHMSPPWAPGFPFSRVWLCCLLSRVWHRLPVFPRLAPVLRFPAFGIGYLFPALGIGCLFSCAWHRLPVSPRLASVACFPALGTGCLFPRAWHRLYVFPFVAPVFRFPGFAIGTVACFPELCTVVCFPISSL